jgi:hypothetical protein
MVALASVACLGLGAAYVMAGLEQNGTPATGGIGICHADSSQKNPFVSESPDASSIVGGSGHASHPDDIIPPFYYIVDGTTYFYPGMNMNTLYGAGFTGAQVLANDCNIPTATGGITQTVTTTTTVNQTTTETITEPGTTITVRRFIVRHPVTVTVSVPEHTVTLPGTTTVVTVSPGDTTTVFLPGATQTTPPVTQTLPGETIEHPPYTVTMPAPSPRSPRAP